MWDTALGTVVDLQHEYAGDESVRQSLRLGSLWRDLRVVGSSLSTV